jgi:protein-L-isoaspartate(D-aspartate) O-methyltransferase
LRHRAYEDAPLPIGNGQTISQPWVHARYLELLSLKGTERVLEIGTGSGYQTVLLAHLVAQVFSIERIPSLARSATERLRRLGFSTVHVREGDGTLGWPEAAPFDAIAVAAAAPELPETLYDQLRPRGRLVVPVGGPRAQRLEVIVRSPEGPAVVHSVPCRFVPLVGEEGFHA